MRRLTMLAALGAFLLPQSAEADTRNFDNYCIMGSFMVCASVRLSTSPDGKHLTAQVWNMFDAYGVQHTMTAIGFYHSGTAWTGSVESWSATWVTPGGSSNISSYWTSKSQEIKTHAGIDLELNKSTQGNSGIVGCNPVPGGGTKWQTCMSFPNPAYVQFDFKLSEAFSLEDVELRWHSKQIAGEYSLKCDTNRDVWDDGSYPPCQVVPEPFTIALLGSGLAGMGGVGLLRRRRKGVDA